MFHSLCQLIPNIVVFMLGDHSVNLPLGFIQSLQNEVFHLRRV